MQVRRLILSTSVAGALISPLAALPAAATPGAGTANWTQWRYGPAHNALQPAESTLTPATVGGVRPSWSLPVSRPQWVVESNPTIAAGVAYLPTWDRHLVAFNASTGIVRWSRKLPGGMFGSAPLDAQRLYTWLSDGTVRAYGTSDGTQQWSVSEPNGGGIPSNSLTEVDGVLYGASWTGDVWARRAATGAQLWRSHISGANFGSPTVWRDEVFVVGDDNALHAVNRSTGAPLWTADVDANWDIPPAVGAGGLVFTVADFGCAMTALDALTGATRWHRALPGHCISAGVMALDDARAYLATDRDDVLAVDAASGSIVWRRHYPGSAFAGGYESQPVVADGVLWLAGGATLWALDLRNGRQLLAQHIPGAYGEPVVAGGRVYVTGTDAALHTYALPD